MAAAFKGLLDFVGYSVGMGGAIVVPSPSPPGSIAVELPRKRLIGPVEYIKHFDIKEFREQFVAREARNKKDQEELTLISEAFIYVITKLH